MNKVIMCCMAFMVLLSLGITKAAEVSPIFRLEMDGAIEADGITYSGDSGSVSVPVTAREDEYGNLPDFSTTPGLMYMDSYSSGEYEADEAMLVNIGTGYNLEQSYIFEAWVMPDYTNWPATGNVMIFRWWQIGDWCDVSGTVTDNFSFLMNSTMYSQRVNLGGSDFYYNSEGDPDKSLSSIEFSHVAVVWTWDSESFSGRADYYLNGELKTSGSGTSIQGVLPELIGIGNESFTAMDDMNELGCGADINFNHGFSGWFDSVALSTFTGEFNGQHEFVLVDPQFCGDVGTKFFESDLNQDCKVNFLDYADLAEVWLYNGFDLN